MERRIADGRLAKTGRSAFVYEDTFGARLMLFDQPQLELALTIARRLQRDFRRTRLSDSWHCCHSARYPCSFPQCHFCIAQVLGHLSLQRPL